MIITLNCQEPIGGTTFSDGQIKALIARALWPQAVVEGMEIKREVPWSETSARRRQRGNQ